MAKKTTWFSLLKRIFVSEPQSRVEKDKRKRWVFRLHKMKQLAPHSTPSPPRERPPGETAEQSNTDLPVIIATDDSKVGQTPSNTRSAHQQTGSQESAESNSYAKIPQVQKQASQDLAATKIQATFRGYLVSFLQKGSQFLNEYLPDQVFKLQSNSSIVEENYTKLKSGTLRNVIVARKALRALKGVVKLQALIRGWAVRQQAINTLRCLQSIVNIQSEVCSKRCARIKDSLYCQDYKSQDFREKDINVDLNSQKRWDDSTLTKEELEAIFLTKREASIKSERIKEYYLNHRRSAETDRDKVYGRRRYWLEQWVDAQLAKCDGDRTLSANARNRDEDGGRLSNLRYLQKQYQAEMSDSPTYIPRRSYHHRKQRSIGDDNSFAGSPAIPAYMASTESAKAKARSLSSPRLRPLSFDVCSEITSPYKHKLSPISSINSELTSSSWVGTPIGTSQRSPRQKGLPGPIKSTMNTKDLRLWGTHYQNGSGVALTSDANPMGK